MSVICSMYFQLEFLNPNYDCALEWEGITYGSLRQALESTKTTDPAKKTELVGMSGWNAVQWGRHLPNSDDRDEWLKRIDGITLALTAQKFGLIHDAPDFKSKILNALWLVGTGDAPLISSGMVCDTLWGICTCASHRVNNISSWEYGTGENLAGEAMEVCRDRLKRNINFDPYSLFCDWCRTKKRRSKNITGTNVVLYFRDGVLFKEVTCNKHLTATTTEARHRSEHGIWHVFPIAVVPAGGTDNKSFLYDSIEIKESVTTPKPTIIMPVTRLALPPPAPWRHRSDKDTWGFATLRAGSFEWKVAKALER